MFVDSLFAKKFYQLQKIIKPTATIEIGAYDADFSLEMLNSVSSKNIWAIEANPFVYNNFKNKLKDINYINCAISNKNEDIVLNIINKNAEIADWVAGASSILDRFDGRSTEPVEIKSMTLDTFVKDNNISGSISLWIDVEGANKEVLTGATETLKQVSSIYIETEVIGLWKDQWLRDDVILFLTDHGFILKQETHGPQRDMIFIKKDLTTSSQDIWHFLNESLNS